MPERNVGVVLTIGGLLVFVAGVLQLLPCLSMAFPSHLGQCWADFLLALVGALLFTR